MTKHSPMNKDANTK